jgi:hypothetical protein
MKSCAVSVCCGVLALVFEAGLRLASEEAIDEVPVVDATEDMVN